MKRRRGLWTVYAAGAVVVAGAMAWVTRDLLALERAQHEARADAAHQEAMRLALWRMDSWLGPALAADADAAPAQPTSRMIRAAYTVRASGEVRAFRGGDDDAAAVARAVDVARARSEIDANDALVRTLVCGDEPALPLDQGENAREYSSRMKAQAAFQNVNAALDVSAARGPLVPLWVGRDGRDPALVFVRRAPYASSSVNWDQGLAVYVADWPRLREGLLQQIGEDVPDADLRATDAPPQRAAHGFVLASAPIELVAPRSAAAALAWTTPTRVTLAFAWSALAASLGAVAFALRRTVDLAERRSRFASSVTHELRTPLTTFRLYSEMLADGMVAEPAQRQSYLETLKAESTRLATLVENVLAYARVEEGRMPVRRERIGVADLLLRAQPPLERRAKEANAPLSVAAGGAAASVVETDPEVVGQILFNLVDNACKYAGGTAISVDASAHDGRVALRVRDGGPGIAPEKLCAAFTPFERAGRPAGDAIPGIGLGLALSRALARDLGGDLDYEPTPAGACFVLTLPTA